MRRCGITHLPLCLHLLAFTVTLSVATSVTATLTYASSTYSRDYVQKAYVAYYGRPADPGGQAYWAGRMDAEGQALDAIIGAFGYSDEFNRRYGGLTHAALVTKIYQQALGRDPDPAGLAWYVGELQAGRRTLQTITLDVLNGATTAPDSTVVANRLDVAAYYTAKVAAGCAYGTEQIGVASLASATAAAATVTAAKAAIDIRCAPNGVPRADAGAGQTVAAGRLVTLDGSASTDPEGDALTYGWTLTAKPAGSAAALSGGNAARPTFTADLPGSYTASLVVNDARSNSVPATVTVTALSAADARKDAARFLRQATFGAPVEAIDALVVQGYDAWLDEQFAKPAVLHVDTVRADPNLRVTGKTGVTSMASIWKQFFEGDDQLRQRVGYALSQIFVVSLNNSGVEAAHCGLAAYADILNRGGFGNFRDLLKDVTLSPVMGEYLSMKGSAKADPVALTQPDENYAREVMQLFTVGLVMLNDDGTPKLGPDGKPQPTFNEDTVQGLARALSGWTHAGQDQSNAGRWIYPDLIVPGPDPKVTTEATISKACPAWTKPMEPWMTQYVASTGTPPRLIAGPAHDVGAKQLMVYPGAPLGTLPAGQSPQTDLENVIDNLFHHPNVGPFIAKQLIQRLVTSNPSGAYVRRVARKFDDNGNGVRGDMKAVVRAILLDDEARSLVAASAPTFGKLSEPAIRFVAFHRAFHGRRASGYYDLRSLGSPDDLGQNPFQAPSVFNFYHPEFSPSGPLTQVGLVGPEFEITNASTIAGFAEWGFVNMVIGFENFFADAGRRIMPDYTEYLPLTDNPAQLIDALELVLCASCLNPAFKTQLVDAIGKVSWGDPSAPGRTEYLRQEKLRAALWQIINSPDYSVQK